MIDQLHLIDLVGLQLLDLRVCHGKGLVAILKRGACAFHQLIRLTRALLHENRLSIQSGNSLVKARGVFVREQFIATVGGEPTVHLGSVLSRLCPSAVLRWWDQLHFGICRSSPVTRKQWGIPLAASCTIRPEKRRCSGGAHVCPRISRRCSGVARVGPATDRRLSGMTG